MVTPRLLSVICFAGLAGTVGILFWISRNDAGPEEASVRLPFLPSRLTTPTGKSVPHGAFPKNDGCLGCHAEIATQWAGSMHAFAQKDPRDAGSTLFRQSQRAFLRSSFPNRAR